jgi:hypothetical protein
MFVSSVCCVLSRLRPLQGADRSYRGSPTGLCWCVFMCVCVCGVCTSVGCVVCVGGWVCVWVGVFVCVCVCVVCVRA